VSVTSRSLSLLFGHCTPRVQDSRSESSFSATHQFLLLTTKGLALCSTDALLTKLIIWTVNTGALPACVLLSTVPGESLIKFLSLLSSFALFELIMVG
jgi:hypothetical protein